MAPSLVRPEASEQQEIAVRGRLVGQDLLHATPQKGHLAGLDLDVDLLALGLAVGLVDENPCVGKSEAAPGGAAGEEHGGRRRRHPHAVRRYGRLNVLHRVVDGEQPGHRSAGRVDVEGDLLVGVLGLQEQQLGHHDVGHALVEGRAQHDHAISQQAGVDVEGPFTARRRLQDGRDEVALCHGASGGLECNCQVAA